MKRSVLKISRGVFSDVVLPSRKEHIPDETQVAACGFFGYGSECLSMDDEYSRDHHFGLWVNMLLPSEVLAAKGQEMFATLAQKLPDTYRGFSLFVRHLRNVGTLISYRVDGEDAKTYKLSFQLILMTR